MSQTKATMRTNAKSKGDGWSLIDISSISAIQMLILVEFANNNVQAVIGRGYCDRTSTSSAINVGTCDSVPNLTGRPSGTDGLVDVVYRGIEGFWGNVWEAVDGVNWNNGTYYVCNDPAKYADDTATDYEQLSFMGATSKSSAYITEEGLDTGNNPHVMLPSSVTGGSESTYYCDAYWSLTDWRALHHGGSYQFKSECGFFASNFNNLSSGFGNTIGSRLLYIPTEG